MTGRRLYEIHCDAIAVAREELRWSEDDFPAKPPAWPFLRHRERRAWNLAAKRVPVRRRS